MAQSFASLVLPPPPSWYLGHMHQFMRLLPEFLTRTDVVLELRDARLPLTSVNRTFEDIIQKWRQERRRLSESFVHADVNAAGSEAPSLRGHSSTVCERIVVMNKRDLVPDWGIEPYTRAMARKFPDQKVIFASWNKPKDVKTLLGTIKKIARENEHVSSELNVLVVGMPNVGKSTLLNALRNIGIPGPTPKALRTSANPGLTRALSTRLKLSQDPLIYSFDSPGIMLPFLGKGGLGAERGIKLALIAGIREGFYDDESLASYLLYRLNVLDYRAPAYLSLLPAGSLPTDDIQVFLEELADRLKMRMRGGGLDTRRAAKWFVNWWREEGCILSANAPSVSSQGQIPSPHRESVATLSSSGSTDTQRGGWGFDFEWTMNPQHLPEVQNSHLASEEQLNLIQKHMEEVIDEFSKREEEEAKEGGRISATQQKKKNKEEKLAKREKRIKQLLASRRFGKT